MSDIDELLRATTRSLAVRWGTNAPYAIGHVSAERIGFAQIPCVIAHVTCRDDDLSALVPVVRQRVFGELAERGWGDEQIETRPTTMQGRRRKFTDENESSKSFRRQKFGTDYRFSFEMRPELAAATFQGFGSFREIPRRES